MYHHLQDTSICKAEQRPHDCCSMLSYQNLGTSRIPTVFVEARVVGVMHFTREVHAHHHL